MTATTYIDDGDEDPRHVTARKIGKYGLLYTVASMFVLFAALPFAWMVFTVFKQSSDLYNGQNNPLLFNEPPTFGNVRLLFEDTNYTTFLWNTAGRGGVRRRNHVDRGATGCL